MMVYRYDTIRREDRLFNTTGREKNPLRVKFYAKNLAYAENYKNVYNECGDVLYEAKLTTAKVSGQFFDMNKDFSKIKTYKLYIDSQISAQRRDYEKFLAQAKTAKKKKMWESAIKGLDTREAELVRSLEASEFQALSDFDLQRDLVAELKSLGFDGYQTTNEIAVF